MKQLNETGLWRLIDQCIRRMNLSDGEYTLYSKVVEIESYHQTIDLRQDTAVLVNIEFDIPYTAQVILDSGNNIMETSKSDYEKLAYAGYQIFQDQITVKTANYGESFTPYRIEFLCISPNKVFHNSIIQKFKNSENH